MKPILYETDYFNADAITKDALEQKFSPVAQPNDGKVGTFQAPTDSYVGALNPANKTQFSVNSPDSPSITPKLTAVKLDYGYRAGVNLYEPAIALSALGGAPEKPKENKFNLMNLIILGAIGFYVYKHFFKRS